MNNYIKIIFNFFQYISTCYTEEQDNIFYIKYDDDEY